MLNPLFGVLESFDDLGLAIAEDGNCFSSALVLRGCSPAGN